MTTDLPSRWYERQTVLYMASELSNAKWCLGFGEEVAVERAIDGTHFALLAELSAGEGASDHGGLGELNGHRASGRSVRFVLRADTLASSPHSSLSLNAIATNFGRIR
jgi:hypothetical protein